MNVRDETGTIQWETQVVILGHYLEVYGKKIYNAKMRTENLSKFSNNRTNELNGVELLCRLNVKIVF